MVMIYENEWKLLEKSSARKSRKFFSCRKVARVCFVMLHVANVFEFMTILNQIKNILNADDSSDGLLRHFSWETFSIILIVLSRFYTKRLAGGIFVINISRIPSNQ